MGMETAVGVPPWVPKVGAGRTDWTGVRVVTNGAKDTFEEALVAMARRVTLEVHAAKGT
jgi:hypothetical protein